MDPLDRPGRSARNPRDVRMRMAQQDPQRFPTHIATPTDNPHTHHGVLSFASLTNAVYSLRSCWRYAERQASGAANGRSEVRAEAIGGPLQATLRHPPPHPPPIPTPYLH